MAPVKRVLRRVADRLRCVERRRARCPAATKDSATQGTEDYPDEELAAITAFRETALDMARWHLTRTDGFEQKAANLLGLSGLALAVVPFAVNDLAGLASWARPVVRVATGFGALALFVGALYCLQVVRPRENASAAPETAQLQEAWAKFSKHRTWTAGDVKGMFADSLLSTPLLDTVKELAERKGCWLGRAAWSVAVAVAGLTIAVVFALIGAQ